MSLLTPQEIENRFEEIWTIYEEAFPSHEQRTRQGQLEAMMGPYYRLFTIEEGGIILAFLGCWELPGCYFIEHLATTPACRGKGYGKELVMDCVEQAEKPVFLEIEPITEADPMTRRRAGFYERLGFCCNHFPYYQQPLKPGDEPCALWVMSHGKHYTEGDFSPFKKEIYNIVYHTEVE